MYVARIVTGGQEHKRQDLAVRTGYLGQKDK
jgi:hypothetical protein